MKDGFARKAIEEITEKLEGLEKLKGELGDLRVRYCKKCKHDTMQTRECRPSFFVVWGSYESSDDTSGNYNYTCLTCGTKWECRDKTVCTEVKPKPAKKKTPKK